MIYRSIRLFRGSGSYFETAVRSYFGFSLTQKLGDNYFHPISMVRLVRHRHPPYFGIVCVVTVYSIVTLASRLAVKSETKQAYVFVALTEGYVNLKYSEKYGPPFSYVYKSEGPSLEVGPGRPWC